MQTGDIDDIKVTLFNCCSANFLSKRVVNIWNALPSYIVQSPRVAQLLLW